MKNLSDEHARDAEVVRVFAGAGCLLRRVNHRGGLADDGEISHLHSQSTLP